MSNINQEALVKHLIAGLLAGGGVGSALVLGRQLSGLHRKAKSQTSSARNDDTVQLVLRDGDGGLSKTASGDSASAAASYLALLAGTAAGFLGVKRMSELHRKKQLQKEIDRAQQLYLDLGKDQLALKRGGSPVHGGVVKQAGTEHNMFAQVAGVPLALGALLALSSAVATNRILKDQFPKPKSPSKSRPKDLDLRVERMTPGTESTEYLAKQAMAHSNSTVADLVYAVASGRGNELRNAVEHQGWDHAFNLTKHASRRKVSRLNKNLALAALSHDPMLSPGFTKLAAAEYADMAEGFVKIAGFIDPEVEDDLLAIGETFNQHTRTKNFEKAFPTLTKSAAGGLGLVTDRWLPRVIVADAAVDMVGKNLDERKAELEEEAEEDPEEVATLRLSDEDIDVLNKIYGGDLSQPAAGEPVE